MTDRDHTTSKGVEQAEQPEHDEPFDAAHAMAVDGGRVWSNACRREGILLTTKRTGINRCYAVDVGEDHLHLHYASDLRNLTNPRRETHEEALERLKRENGHDELVGARVRVIRPGEHGKHLVGTTGWIEAEYGGDEIFLNVPPQHTYTVTAPELTIFSPAPRKPKRPEPQVVTVWMVWVEESDVWMAYELREHVYYYEDNGYHVERHEIPVGCRPVEQMVDEHVFATYRSDRGWCATGHKWLHRQGEHFSSRAHGVVEAEKRLREIEGGDL